MAFPVRAALLALALALAVPAALALPEVRGRDRVVLGSSFTQGAGLGEALVYCPPSVLRQPPRGIAAWGRPPPPTALVLRRLTAVGGCFAAAPLPARARA